MTERRADLLVVTFLVVLSIVRGMFWIGMYPAFKIVDEPAHFDDVQFRAEHSLHAPRVPLGAVDRVQGGGTSRESKDLWTATQVYWRGRFLVGRNEVPEEHALAKLAHFPNGRETDGQSSVARYPGFYYTLGAALPYWIARHVSVLRRLFALRLYSLAWGTLLVVFAFYAARVALRDRVVAFTVALFAMFQPMAAQQTVGVTVDAAVFALCALVFWAQLVIVTREGGEPALRWWITIAVGTALALETKPTAIALVPGTVLLVVRALSVSPRRMGRMLGLSALVFAATWLGVHLACDHVVLGDTITSGSGLTPRSVLPAGQGFLGFLWSIDKKFLDEITTTGWSAFAWYDTKMSPEWIDDLHAASIVFWLSLPAAASLRWLYPHRPRFFVDRAVLFSAFTAIVGVVVLLHTEYATRLDLHLKHAVQGRELLVVLTPVACVGAAALGSLVPTRFRTLLFGLVCLGIALMATGTATTVIAGLYVD